jgi:2'-5' RNA ligase
MDRDGAQRPARGRRLFVGVEVSAPAHRAIDRALAPWRTVLDVRWVPAERRHVTVRFLGSVAPGSVRTVADAVTDAARSVGPVDARLTRLGAFPSSRRAGVLWVGLDDRSGRLTALAAALDAALAPEFPPPTRALRPHVTVARSPRPIRLPGAFAATPVESVALPILRAVLFESVPTGRAPRYEAVHVAELSG